MSASGSSGSSASDDACSGYGSLPAPMALLPIYFWQFMRECVTWDDLIIGRVTSYLYRDIPVEPPPQRRPPSWFNAVGRPLYPYGFPEDTRFFVFEEDWRPLS